jgi:PAS domain S-box-containing protein
MKDIATDLEKRVLVVSPTRRDGEITASLLARTGISSVVCRDLRELVNEMASGVGALLLTDDALTGGGLDGLLALLNTQPSWSDLSVILLMPGGEKAVVADELLGGLGNVALLERPAGMRSLVSAVQAAIRGRERQYRTREQIEIVRRAQATTRQVQQQLEIAVEASELGTFHCEVPLGKILWNDRCKAHFWLSPDAQVDLELFYSILHPDDRERTRNAVEACVYDRKPYDIEYRTVSPKGEIRWIRATGRTFYDELNAPIRFDGTTQDITVRKEAEIAQAKLVAIIESSDDAIVSKTLDGIITSWNQGAERLFGHTAAQAVGKSILLIVPPDRRDEEADIIRRLRKGKRIEHFETQRVTRDGRLVDISLTVSPIRDSAGTIVGASKIARDITERQRIEQDRDKLLEAERHARAEAQRVNRLKDEFLATLSHELRTPLNAILGWSQLIRGGGADAQTLEEGISVIERNARVQVQLIEDLLDMSRIVSGKIRLDMQTLEPASFIDAAIKTVTPSAEAKGIRIQQILTQGAAPILGDSGRLHQVVWNLLANAIKFTPKGGRVQVALKQVNSHVEISVSDTGQGIKPEFLPHVFERFRQADASMTRAHGGLGLGLAIVKNLVELHGGTIQAESMGEGKGSTFTISLPITVVHRRPEVKMNGDESLEPVVLSGSKSGSLDGISVLVVDDEPDARDLIRRVLKECDATVFTAGSAPEALKVLQQENPNVLVSDIGMPRIDGYDFLKQVRMLGSRKGGNVPAIALTAFARSEDRTRALMAGYNMHVSKPVEPQELIATVASVAARAGDKK